MGIVRKYSLYVKVLMGAGVSIYILIGRLFLLFSLESCCWLFWLLLMGVVFLLMRLLIRTCRGGTSHGGDSWDTGGCI